MLIATLGAGSLSFSIFDPITILTRTMTTSILLSLNDAVTAIERALWPLDFLRGPLYVVASALRRSVIPIDPPAFRQSRLLGLLFAGVLALNAVTERFWCRYLCPLGALLGPLSTLSLIRPKPGPTCDRYGLCADVCRLEATDPRRECKAIASECSVYLDCIAGCLQAGYGTALRRRPAAPQPYGPSRRQVLALLAAGPARTLLLKTSPHRKAPNPTLIGPPGGGR